MITESKTLQSLEKCRRDAEQQKHNRNDLLNTEIRKRVNEMKTRETETRHGNEASKRKSTTEGNREHINQKNGEGKHEGTWGMESRKGCLEDSVG